MTHLNENYGKAISFRWPHQAKKADLQLLLAENAKFLLI